jgi:hypothetical protein
VNKAPGRPLRLIAAAAAAAVAVTALAVADVAPADTSGLKRTITFQETEPVSRSTTSLLAQSHPAPPSASETDSSSPGRSSPPPTSG